MQKADTLLRSWRGLVLFIVPLLVIVADQLTKNLWIRTYPEGHLIYKLGFIRIVHVQNTGSAFGIFQDQSFILTIVAIVGVTVILSILLFLRSRFQFLRTMPNLIGLSLMLAGSTGNLIDRLTVGHVTDFLDVGFWPVFNIADSSLVIGEIIIAYSLLRLALAKKD